MIKIEIKKSKKVNGEASAFVSFPYDPEIINLMRKQSNRFWHAEEKIWELSISSASGFIKDLGNRPVTLEIEKSLALPKAIKVPSGFQFKTEPFQHQIEGFEYGFKKDQFLLADEQGLGKTKQVIDIAVAKKISSGYKHCLIICGVNGLKWNWKAEIARHSDEDSHILGSRINGKGKSISGSNKDKLTDLENLGDAYFLITNVESLRDKPVLDRLKKLADSGELSMVVIDEIHKCKNPASQQGKAILQLGAETKIAMTGTPLMNQPLDLFVILKWLGYEKHSFFQFKKHYCVMGGYGGYEIVGYKNLNQLHENLNDLMLRRLKKEVLDLPEKIQSVEYVEMDSTQARIYEDVRQTIQQNIDKIKLSANPLSQLTRLRQATGFTGILSEEIQVSAKLDRLEELVEELVANNEKAIVFSNWTDMVTPTLERLKRFNPAVITGEVKNREEQQNRFMEDPRCKVIVGTIGAMGTGLTLTAASTVIFLDSPWNRANKEQAEDRAHRIGSTSTVNIITLVCKDTIDERIEQILHNKGIMADALVDGNFDANHSELVDFLLG